MYLMDTVETAVLGTFHLRVDNVFRLRLGDNYFHVRVLFLEELTYAVCGSACADTADEDIYFSVGIFPDLRTGVLVVCIDVIRVIQLTCRERMLHALFHVVDDIGKSSDTLFKNTCDQFLRNICDLCLISLQELQSFNGHTVLKTDLKLIALCCGKSSHRDTCVTGCKLNKRGLIRADLTTLFCGLDDLDRHSVLVGSCRIEVLKFSGDTALQAELFFESFEFYDRGMSDQFCD